MPRRRKDDAHPAQLRDVQARERLRFDEGHLSGWDSFTEAQRLWLKYRPYCYSDQECSRVIGLNKTFAEKAYQGKPGFRDAKNRVVAQLGHRPDIDEAMMSRRARAFLLDIMDDPGQDKKLRVDVALQLIKVGKDSDKRLAGGFSPGGDRGRGGIVIDYGPEEEEEEKVKVPVLKDIGVFEDELSIKPHDVLKQIDAVAKSQEKVNSNG
jgi:hypothetical protein